MLNPGFTVLVSLASQLALKSPCLGMQAEITSSLPLHPADSGLWVYTAIISLTDPLPQPRPNSILFLRAFEAHSAMAAPGNSLCRGETLLFLAPSAACTNENSNIAIRPSHSNYQFINPLLPNALGDHDGSHKLEEDLFTQALRLRGSIAPSHIPGSKRTTYPLGL